MHMAKGVGGTITVTAASLSLEEGGVIYANTTGPGHGGTITVKADELHATGGKMLADTYGAGDAGDIFLEGKNMSFMDGAQVGAGVREGSTGKGGNIMINATGAVAIGGGEDSAGSPSGLFSDTYGKGTGGNITVTAASLSLEEGGLIEAATNGAGHGGTISIKAGELYANGGVIGTATLGSGDAGDIVLSGTNLFFTSGSQVDTSAWKGSTGNGGSIKVNATGSVTIAGKDGKGYQSGFFSGTESIGEGGNISVTTGNLSIKDGGTISAESSSTGNAGSINIHAGNLLSLDNGTIETKAEKAPGGNINITGKDIQLTHNSSINTSVTSGVGNGGNIGIDASTLVLLEESNIMANAALGHGGDVIINADAVFQSPDSKITATSKKEGQDGKIIVNSPVLDIMSAMVPLRESFLSADELLPERCETRDPEQAGSFIVDSGEGLPPRPDELLR